ncbi:MAG TPA: hypothetical protein DDZ81_02875 [Acetobacteraceae bacterium]|jgi:hypothetical protein|nr:hypothetical protein [Acetobacteraceae bacterium]
MYQPPLPPPVPPAMLLKAARRLMRPLVRLMMDSGLTFPILADTLRSLFVDVAINDILTDPKARTDSRISLLTGVHRKEIKRLRETPADVPAIPEVVTLVSQIVARWVGSAAFTDASGRPRPLDRVRQPARGDAPAFDGLVGAITTDVRPRAVLDNLLAHGVVHIDSDDRVQLDADAFIPRPGGEEQLFYFARNLHDHVAAAVANISAPGTAPFLDRSVHYDRLTPEQARELDAYARAAARRVLLDVNRRAMDLAGAEPAEAEPDRYRVNFGIYVFGERESEVGGDAS